MLNKIQGTVIYTNQSFGFLETTHNESYFIPPQELKKVLPNDIVECTIVQENDKEFVVIEKLISKGQSEFIGKIEKGGNNYFLNIEDSPLSFFIKRDNSLRENDWVKCKLITHPFETKSSVVFKEFISDSKNERLYWDLAIAYNDIKNEEYNQELKKEDFKLSNNKRIDHRNKNYFTVDGNKKTESECLIEKRDRDDAICIEENDLGYKVYIAISDVAEYVKENTFLDNHAKLNTTSYYLFDKVIPMLPRKLSEDLLSLNQNEDRPSIVCEMLIDFEGEVKSYDFYEALINSKAQLSYDLISQYFKEGCSKEYKFLENDIMNFEKVGDLRKKYREVNNVVFENRIEYKIELEKSRIKNVKKVEQLDSARYIEELMVSANWCFGRFIKDKNQEAIYNKFLGYSKKKQEDLLSLIEKYNLNISKEDIYSFQGYKKIQSILSKEPENIKVLFNRHLDKAMLSKEQVPHYGLGLEEGYATFTSPLRKYIDLINHRVLKSILRNEEIYKFEEEELIKLKENQLKQRKAENYIKNNLYIEYMYNKKDINYEAKVVFINNRGAKIQLEENGVTGLLPLEEILKNNCDYDNEEKLINIKENVVKIGDIFNVSLKNINKYKKQIEFKI